MLKTQTIENRKIKLLLTLFSLFFAISLFSESIEVLEQNENYVVVKFILPEYSIDQIEENGEVFHKIVTQASNVYAEMGKPILPYFSHILGVPVDGDIQIEVLESTHKIEKSINIIPAKKETLLNSKNIEYNFYKDIDFYKLSKNYPTKLMNKGELSFLRDRALISFRINAFQFNPKKHTLQITTSLTAKIYIQGDKKISRNWRNGNNYIDKVGDSFFINNATSQNWRKELEPVDSYPNRNLNIIDAINITVSEEGIYKITKDMLEEAISTYIEEYEIEQELAFDWDNLDPRFLELSDENGNIPIHFVGENDGNFDDGDYFEFFGQPHHGETAYYDDYTNENTYSLKIIDHIASRMAVENGGLQNSDPHNFTVPASYEQTVHIEKQNSYSPLGYQFNFDRDYFREDIWFWSKINAPSLMIFPFELQFPHDSNIRKMEAKVCLFGASFDKDYPNNINHHAIVRINSSLIGNQMWAGQREILFENEDPIANTLLTNGTNNLYVSLPGVPGYEIAQVLLDYLELKYWREYKTSEDFIRFTKPSNKPLGLFQFEVDNFSTSDINVYKIGSSYMENVQITSFTEAGDPPYKITFQDSVIAENYEYFAVTESMKKAPVKIVPDIPSYLKSNTNSADYVIITASEFTKNEGTLLFKELRESEGHTVQIVDLQNIFDEFNSGIRSIQAMKDFVSYAYNNWSSPQLTHVLLLGDGMNDERDFSSDRTFNIIPFKKIWVSIQGAVTSDNWLGCVVGDDMIPDVSISRITVWDEEQILPIAQKSESYLNSPNYNDTWHSSLTLAAGGNPDEGTIFAKQSERIRMSQIPKEYNMERVYCNVTDLPETYAGNTTSLIGSINDGTSYIQFMGHGGGQVWADYNLLNIADINTFNNENYPFFCSFSCYGSAFGSSRQSNCIGEELIIAPNKGAIAHFGFTGYGYLEQDEYFASHLTHAMFQLKIGNIGNITDYAKARFYADSPSASTNYALVQGGALLGDNMATILYPQEEQNLTLENSHLEPGDTLKVSSFVGTDAFAGKFIIYDENDSQLSLLDYFPLPASYNDGTLSTNSVTNYIVPSSTESALYNVKLFAYGAEKEITGQVSFTVGKANVQNIIVFPEEPTSQDSITITADFITDENIANINLIEYRLDNDNDEILLHSYPLELIEGITYRLSEKIPPKSNEFVRYYFTVTYEDDTFDDTERFMYRIKIADLYIQNTEVGISNNQPTFRIFSGNVGQQTSLDCYYKLYSTPDNSFTLVDSVEYSSLAPGESRWNEIAIPLYTIPTQFKATINESELFPESNYYNNKFTTGLIEFNMFEAGAMETIAFSSDENLECTFPQDLLLQNTVFYINNIGIKEALNQPNTNSILLADSLQYSTAYEIGALNSDVFADSLGHFTADKTINLKFHYFDPDALTQIPGNSDNFEVYRWEPLFEKWISQKGNMNFEDNYVSVNVDRIGIYTIFQNTDEIPPFVEANVEGQEFTYGGYVAHNGIISILLSDANGIDIFDNKVRLFLDANSTPLDEADYNITARKGNLTNIPIKYQLDLTPGDHYLTVDCTDVNGNLFSHEIKFSVNKDFELLNVANYPNPVKSQATKPVNEGRTRFTYVLTEDADEIEIKVYTVSGRLVKTFDDVSPSIGYHEYPRTLYGWDCRDNQGYPLANGVYFYKVTAKKGKKTITKTMKMAILK